MPPALQASISVPGIFPPVKIDDEYYVDGGIANPTPIDVVLSDEIDLVIGVDLVMKKKVKLENPKLIDTVMQTYEIIRSQAIEHRLDNEKTILIQPEVGGPISSFKFMDIPKFIGIGEKAAEEKLEEIKNLL